MFYDTNLVVYMLLGKKNLNFLSIIPVLPFIPLPSTLILNLFARARCNRMHYGRRLYQNTIKKDCVANFDTALSRINYHKCLLVIQNQVNVYGASYGATYHGIVTDA